MRTTTRVFSRVWLGPRMRETTQGLFTRLASHPSHRIALRDATGVETYGELTKAFRSVSARLKSLKLQPSQGTPARVGILQSPGREWVHSLLGCWHARCVVVPLSPKYPAPALKPMLDDAGIDVVLSDAENFAAVSETGRKVALPVRQTCEEFSGAEVDADLNEVRMLLYTSGTTGKPKGVVWNERMVRHHLSVLTDVWRWSDTDKTICTLPLHHVHGIVNVILCALYSGASVDFHSRFDAASVWDALLSENAPNVFMGVPTMYRRLIAYYESVDLDTQLRLADAAKRARLFVAGSAALPAQDAAAWSRISGVPALERYGMTETGMTLSSPYDERTSGALGAPLPGVEAMMSEDGELLVRGDGVFERYWQRDEIQALDEQGWFRTGDIVRRDEEKNSFVMMGRASTDIIKTAGYKVSALEIEECIRSVEGVMDAAVVGVNCDELGERIVAGVILSNLDVQERMFERLRAMLPKYKIPREVKVVDEFPRNEMGKVQKKVLSKMWEKDHPEEVVG